MGDEFYVISVKHTRRSDLYITIWRPDDQGYCWALSNAGKYGRSRVMAHLGYYNSGCSNVAVLCHVLDGIAIEPKPGHHDNDAGPVVANNRASWDLINSNLIDPPQYQLRPEFPGARRRKD